MGTLERVTRGRAAISITHRFSTVVSADRIFVLADGQVIEERFHAALIAASMTSTL